MIEIEIDEDIILPCYRHFIDSTADINFVWGGRDGGKSYGIAQTLLIESLNPGYFRCILIKKTHESIKDSQWQLLKDIATDWGIDHLFTFKTSPLEIICKHNGNKFIARGCDKPEKMKSISNPSHAWFEEGNQLTLQDYIVSSTTLRSNNGKVKQWFSFNPEPDGDYTNYWLFKTYFAHHTDNYSFNDNITTTLPDGSKHVITYTSTHTTYHDNPYCTAERRARLESLKAIDPFYYQVFTLGQWGNISNDSPWAVAFSYDNHVGRPVLSREHEVYLSFDFNRNPACCSVIQHYNGKVRVLETIKKKGSGTDSICRYVLEHYSNCLYIVTGDYSGNTASSLFEEEITNYTVIQNTLGLADGQIQILPNPKLKKNSLLVNTILAEYPVEIHETAAYGLIYDMQNVKRLADGTIEKTDRNDEAQQADALDTFRYFCNRFMKDHVNAPKV